MRIHTTGSLARECGISERTVKNYADAGLLSAIRDESGRRLFPETDVQRVRELYLERVNQRGRR